MLWVVVAGLAGLASINALRTARTQLISAKSALDSVVSNASSLTTASGRAAASVQARQALAEATAASGVLHRSLGLTVLRYVPVAWTQRNGAVQLADDAQEGARVGLSLIAAADSFATQARLQRGMLPLSPLRTLASQVTSAESSVFGLVRSGGGLIGPLASARQQIDVLAATTANRLQQTADSLRAATTFLGSDGPRRYLVAAENNAEMRDQGAVLSYSVVDFDRGRVTIEHSGPISELALTQPVPVGMPVGMREFFADTQPTLLWQSANTTADFPWSGAVMATMYRQATGHPVDGVIALDVPTLADVLGVTGPIAVDGIPQPVTSANVTDILLNQLYAALPAGSDTGERRELESRVASRLMTRIQSGDFDAVQLGRQLGEAAAGGHIKLWSSRPAEETLLTNQDIGGTPATALPDRTFHWALENGTANKLDYLVHPSARVQVTVDGSGAAHVHTAITVANDSPAGAQPSYQLGAQLGQYPVGYYIGRLYFWSPEGSRTPGATTESGLALTEQNIGVAPGQRVTVTFDSTITDAVRDGALDLRLVPPPRAVAVPLTVTLSAPGRRVTGAALQQGTAWNRDVVLHWAM